MGEATFLVKPDLVLLLLLLLLVVGVRQLLYQVRFGGRPGLSPALLVRFVAWPRRGVTRLLLLRMIELHVSPRHPRIQLVAFDVEVLETLHLVDTGRQAGEGVVGHMEGA